MIRQKKSPTAERFGFGKNWKSFSEGLRPEDYFGAKESLEKLVPNLKDKTFLDVGCGSGLFSIAASALGAKKVLGIDVDPECIATSKKLADEVYKWDQKVRKNAIEFRTESILSENTKLQRYDIVYSWGVLHHTGDMYKAFETIKNLVADKGILVLAIYNRHITSPLWKAVKYTYVKSPRFIRKILVFLFLIVKFFGVLITSRQNPLKKQRGMRYYTDVVDWVGGYPYEYASIDEVRDFFQARGFVLKNCIKTTGFTGCNEFVFQMVS
jgi:2-polyprenyl-6-hydroxyphenyl methylase/3-demethylubiquinone-9 3-methyltransferase